MSVDKTTITLGQKIWKIGLLKFASCLLSDYLQVPFLILSIMWRLSTPCR